MVLQRRRDLILFFLIDSAGTQDVSLAQLEWFIDLSDLRGSL